MLTNETTGENHDLPPVVMLGRSPECNVQIADPRVSRRHAMIRRQEDGFWFFDLGSFNGSYLNGSRVTAARRLTHGDVLDFADNQFRFEQEGNAFDTAEEDSFGSSTIALIRSAPVIILVSDIQGFTALSEQLPPDILAQTIGGYAACEEILSRHGATVDKFIGDCVLAYWTQVTPETRLDALRAAHELMLACTRSYEERREIFDSIGRDFRAGLALHVGKVAYGGMSQREFTLVGDPVNLTFRIETLTRELGHPAIVSGDFLRDWPEGRQYCQSLGVHQVKGRAQPVEAWMVREFPE